MRYLALSLLLASQLSYGAVAFFTGESFIVNNGNFNRYYACEYEYMGNRMWFKFDRYCPNSINI